MYLLQASSVDLNLGVHLYSKMKTSTTFVKEYSKECRVSKTSMKARSIEMHKTIMSPGPHSSVPYGQREADGTGHSGGREAETRDCYLTQWANTNRLSPVTRLLLSERVDKNVIPTFICPQVVFTCDAWSKWPFFFADVYFGAGTFDSQRSHELHCTCLLSILDATYLYLFTRLKFRNLLV